MRLRKEAQRIKEAKEINRNLDKGSRTFHWDSIPRGFLGRDYAHMSNYNIFKNIRRKPKVS